MDTTVVTPSPDLAAVKTRQQDAWSSGDYAIVGTTLQIVGEQLCEALDIRAGQKVLDVAAGNGNVSLAAARRWCEVTSTDYVPSLLERGRKRAEAEGLTAAVPAGRRRGPALRRQGVRRRRLDLRRDVHAQPGARGGGDGPRLQSGGKIGLANWTPDGFIGQLFKTLGKHVAPPAGVKSPALWGTKARARGAVQGPGARRSASSRGPLRFATARPSTSSRSSAPTTGPCTRHSTACRPAPRRRSRAISWR